MSSNKEKDVQDLENANAETAANEIENESYSEDELDDLVIEQQKKINELEEEVQRLKDSQLRRAAEVENMRKRMHREREQIYQTAREAALEEFLPINDDLIRTLNALKESDAESPYLDGVQMIANKFGNVLEKHGVERIDETGVPFDVDLHDALLRQKPEDDSIDSGIVLQIIENGYKIGDKTIRHAKVIVSE